MYCACAFTCPPLTPHTLILFTPSHSLTSTSTILLSLLFLRRALLSNHKTNASGSNGGVKKDILSRDRDLRLAQYEGRADMSTVVEVERAIGWPRLWDLALDHGPKCIDGLRNLVRVITFPPHALSACPLCEEDDISRDSLLSHVLTTHSRSPCNSDKLLSLLLSIPDSDSVLFNYLANLFWILIVTLYHWAFAKNHWTFEPLERYFDHVADSISKGSLSVNSDALWLTWSFTTGPTLTLRRRITVNPPPPHEIRQSLDLQSIKYRSRGTWRSFVDTWGSFASQRSRVKEFPEEYLVVTGAGKSKLFCKELRLKMNIIVSHVSSTKHKTRNWLFCTMPYSHIF